MEDFSISKYTYNSHCNVVDVNALVFYRRMQGVWGREEKEIFEELA